jgi:UDP-N-acetylmuramoylalanine--D-glutamate ligase
MNTSLQNSTYIVIGAGISGQSIINYLLKRQAKILRILDTRSNPPQIKYSLPIIGGDLIYANLSDADIIVISPGVSIYEPALQYAIKQGKQVIGDIELFAQEIKHWSSKVIAITGSNGKTTVTSLTGFLAQQAGIKTLVAGNIGTPVLDALLDCEDKQQYPELIVLELSSFQLETTYNLNLASATVLNISEDHLDRYRDLLEYAHIKANIFNNCTCQVLNAHDPLVMAMFRHNSQQLYFAGTHSQFRISQDSLIIDDKEYLALQQLKLIGKHNYENCLASLALLAGANYNLEQFKLGLAKFKGLEHRMQKVAQINDILFIEDSKGTNVGAVLAGVSGIDQPVHLILGGDGKGQDFTPLRQLVVNQCKSVAIIGQDAPLIAQVLAGIEKVNCYPDLTSAVHACINLASAGDAVILSPACASWDMFDNYKHRAQIFVEAIYAYFE